MEQILVMLNFVQFKLVLRLHWALHSYLLHTLLFVAVEHSIKQLNQKAKEDKRNILTIQNLNLEFDDRHIICKKIKITGLLLINFVMSICEGNNLESNHMVNSS